MSCKALNGAPEIWDSFSFLPLPSGVTQPSYFPVFTSAGSKVPPSMETARPAREGEEKEGGILHPGFVHNRLGTILPGQRSWQLHSWASQRRMVEDIPKKMGFQKNGEKVQHPFQSSSTTERKISEGIWVFSFPSSKPRLSNFSIRKSFLQFSVALWLVLSHISHSCCHLSSPLQLHGVVQSKKRIIFYFPKFRNDFNCWPCN